MMVFNNTMVNVSDNTGVFSVTNLLWQRRFVRLNAVFNALNCNGRAGKLRRLVCMS